MALKGYIEEQLFLTLTNELDRTAFDRRLKRPKEVQKGNSKRKIKSINNH